MHNREHAQNSIACPSCDALIYRKAISRGQVLRCTRCKTELSKYYSNPRQRSLAASLTGLILFVPATSLPILKLELLGITHTNSVISSSLMLWDRGFWLIASLVFLSTVIAPLCYLLLIFTINLGLRLRRALPSIRWLLMLEDHLEEWSMLEIYFLGVLLSLIKLHDMGGVTLGYGSFCLAGLILMMLISNQSYHSENAWQRWAEAEKLKKSEPVS